jgi:tetratricopeptide (TPR) repeat protein
MYEGYVAVALASANKRVKFGVLLVLAALSAADGQGQSLGFVPASSRTRPTVSVRELQIPVKAKSNFQHGLERLAKHDPEGSKKFFAAAIAEAPDFYEAYYHRGIAEAQLDQNEAALRSFQAAIDLSDGHEPRAEFGYAMVLSRVGSASEAECIVRHGLLAGANIPDGHVVLGLILLKLNRVDEAEKSAQEALLLRQPSSAKGHLILADVRAARRDFAGQAQELEAYLKRNPEDRNRKTLETARDVARKLAAAQHQGQ